MSVFAELQRPENPSLEFLMRRLSSIGKRPTKWESALQVASRLAGFWAGAPGGQAHGRLDGESAAERKREGPTSHATGSHISSLNHCNSWHSPRLGTYTVWYLSDLVAVGRAPEKTKEKEVEAARSEPCN